MAGSVHTAAYTDLLRQLVEARNAARISQAQLAQAIGKPASFVGKYELGERRLDMIELLVILRKLDVNEKAFIGGLVKNLPETL